MLLSFWAVYFRQGNWGQDNDLIFSKSEHFQPLLSILFPCTEDLHGNANPEFFFLSGSKKMHPADMLFCRNTI